MKVGGVVSFEGNTCEQSTKVFSVKIFFSTHLRKFSPSKVSCYTVFAGVTDLALFDSFYTKVMSQFLLAWASSLKSWHGVILCCLARLHMLELGCSLNLSLTKTLLLDSRPWSTTSSIHYNFSISTIVPELPFFSTFSRTRVCVALIPNTHPFCHAVFVWLTVA